MDREQIEQRIAQLTEEKQAYIQQVSGQLNHGIGHYDGRIEMLREMLQAAQQGDAAEGATDDASA